MTTSVSPVISNVSSTSPLLLSSSPQRVHSTSPTASSVHTIPATLITNSNNSSSITTSNGITATNKFVSNQNVVVTSTTPVISSTQSQILKKVLPNGLTSHSNGLTTATKAHPISINLSANEGISPALLAATNAAMPLNLNINANSVSASNGLQIISTKSTKSGGKNGIRQTIDISEQGALINGNHTKEQKSWDSKSDFEPPTKVIKLINANIALASVDKDSKMIPSNHQLTYSQVVVPLPQSVRVIGQTPNGLSAIELGNSNGKWKVN